MSPLLGHILAQVVSLGVADRTEGRYIAAQADKRYEAATYLRTGLSLTWKHGALNVGYAPSLVVTPLDSPAREALIFHSMGIAGSYHWQRTIVTASESVGIGEINFQSQGLGDPRALAPAADVPNAPSTTPGAGTPTAPGTPPATGNPGTGTTTGSPVANQTANRIRAINQTVTFATSVTALDVTQTISPVFWVSGGIGYFVGGSFGSRSTDAYPIVRGPRAQASASYQFSPRDGTSSQLTAQYASIETGNNSWIYTANESWSHLFDKKTSSRLGVGVSASRTSQPDGLIAWSIYPTFISSINYATAVDRSQLTLSLSASSAPALDPVRATVDPRLNLGASAGWTLKRFYTGLAANSALSLTQQQGNGTSNGGLSSVAGSFTMSYQLADPVSLDSGLRAFWQKYYGDNVVPLTWAAFVGFTVTPL